MGTQGKKVLVALSGGVDSSTAAALLLQQGYDCEGVFMVAHDYAQPALQSARAAAEQLRIRLHVLDLRGDFARIIEYFCREYETGRTPNPCVLCNRTIKFGKLWDFAADKGACLLATGHYARILPADGRAGLFAAVDQSKDQSYALAMIDRNMLDRIILPVGCFTKTQTRQMARRLGLPTAERRDSQEICFIPDNDHVAFLESRCPRLVRKGPIVDGAGRLLGEHNGIHRFTVGQRRGVRIAMGRPWYVVKVDAETNTVTLGPKEEVMHTKLAASDVNWLIDRPAAAFKAMVRIRYNAKPAEAVVVPQGANVSVAFERPVAAVTPGQLACFYVRNGANMQVAGAGWIENAR